MFKEMTTRKKMIIGGIIALILIIAIVLFIRNRNKKKKAAELAESKQNVQEQSEPVQRRPKSQIIPEEDILVHKNTAEAPISVKEAIPETKVQAPAPQQKAPVASQPKVAQQPAGSYKSALGDEFMQDASIGGH